MGVVVSFPTGRRVEELDDAVLEISASLKIKLSPAVFEDI